MEQTSAKTETVEYPPSPYFSIFILTLATFMQVLDTTIVNVALPKMAGDFGISPYEANWIVGSYLIATAAVLPITGWLATFFGRKNYYLGCCLLFTLSSVLCGLAVDYQTMILARILQGICGAGLAPCEQAIIADIVPQEKLGRAFSIYGTAIALAPILGPTCGGFITDTFGWRWIFFINLPFGILSLILTGLFVQETKRAKEAQEKFRRAGKTVDWLGILLFITGIAALELFLETAPRENWFESDFVFSLALFAFFALLIGLAWEYYQKQPAVDIFMFANSQFTIVFILGFAVGFILTGTTFLLPYMTQTLLGYTAMDAGMISLPATIVQLIGIQFVGSIMNKVDIRHLIFFGLAVVTFSVWQLTSINLNIEYNSLVFIRIIQLFGLSFLAVTINTIAYYNISPDKNNSASALMNLARTMGASFGIALTSTILALRTQVHLNDLGRNFSDSNFVFTETIDNLSRGFQTSGLNASDAGGLARGIMLEESFRQASMNAVIDTFYVYLVLFICVIPLVFLLKVKKK